MPEQHEFATRQEVNGLGMRLNQVTQDTASHEKAIEVLEQGQRDLWTAVNKGRDEDARIERLVNQISVKVAGIATLATIAQAFIVWYFTQRGGTP